MTTPARLDPSRRADAWRRFEEHAFDVLVVGGGITGSGVALDAATRGLSTALVEARDIASGTSSRSSKLIHGGLRYLEQLDFTLVREALRERELMLSRLAPHLVHPVPFLYPLTHRGWERPYVGAGLGLYDTLGGTRSLPRHRHLSRRAALVLCPALRRDALVGAVRYYDAQTDDARHTLTVARTAAHYGAVVRTSTRAIRLVRDAGRVVGAEVLDTETGSTTVIRSAVVVACAGVWTDEVEALAGVRGRFDVRASKGVHLVVPRDRIASEVGLILRTETSVLLVIPWGNYWIVGTTDTDWTLDLVHPAASRADVDYLLGQVNRVLTRPLTRADVSGVYAGLRPLLAGESDETSRLSRSHAAARPMPGLVMVAGGKYTTYRVMAADAVNLAASDLDRAVPASVTADVPLLGAEGYPALVNQVDDLAARYALPTWRIRRLLGRYGSLVFEVLDPAAEDPALLHPLPDADEYLRAEIRYGATHEGALHLDDLLTRRTRVSIEVADRGVRAAPDTAECVADVLGWSPSRQAAEVDVYTGAVAAELRAQESPDDIAAVAARMLAPDTRAVPRR
ncbi:MAG TPA: glycerol-3-phosphate dehydrogenase/oxidase [Jiangellaceae bacterium]|nr:glycerol-3-phosphate dehydrogenase/oxidase [Jiangellaceae bacterium]